LEWLISGVQLQSLLYEIAPHMHGLKVESADVQQARGVQDCDGAAMKGSCAQGVVSERRESLYERMIA